MGQEMATFGAVLRQFRTAAALSQEELAERAGLSLRGISDLERGVRRSPYLATVRQLADALGLGPHDRQVLLAAARASPLAGSDTLVPQAGLPRPPTTLIGREEDVAALMALVQQPSVELVTVIGSGGSGKTRLALEVGSRFQEVFGQIVVFVDLSPVREARHVLAAIAHALGVREIPGETLSETLSHALAERPLLLIVDNCEHVVSAADSLAALLAACPNVTMLATSREPLRVRAERVMPLAPLPLPEAQHHLDLDLLAGVPSVALFVERAHAIDPGFTLTNENAAAVASICRRLDGLPLGIELAAARIKLLPPAMLLQRLDRRLPLLAGGARDLPARQRTLRDAIAWSYDLLGSDEQTLLQRLAIFHGGWTLEGAEAIASDGGTLDVLEGMASLLDKSLVHQREQSDGSVRFGMLETVREFALDLLTAEKGATQVQRLHATYYQHLAETTDIHALLPGQEPWLVRLEAEMPNIRAALGWLISHDPGAALALAGALRWFWLIRGNLTEGRTILEDVVAVAVDAPLLVRARALIGLGFLEAILGDTARAEPALRAGQTLAQQGDNLWEQGWALLGLGIAATRRQAHAEGEALLQEAVAVIEPLAAHHPAARARVFAFLCDLGGNALARGELELATVRLETALGGARETGFSWLESLTLINLGMLATRRGDLLHALACHHEALAIAWKHNDRRLAVEALEEVAAIAHGLGQPNHARDVLTLAAALRRAVLLPPANAPVASGEALLSTGPDVTWDEIVLAVTGLLEHARGNVLMNINTSGIIQP